MLAIDQNNSKFDFQQLLFSSLRQKLLLFCPIIAQLFIHTGGPPKFCFIELLRKNFRKFGICVVLWDPIFLEKIYQRFDICSECFSQNPCSMLQNGLSGKIVKNFDEMTCNTLHRQFLENLENLEIF